MRRYLNSRRTMPLVAVVVLWCAVFAARDGIAEEINYPAAEFSKLDTFEGLSIEDGDKFFAQKDYKAAYIEYKTYSEQFQKGKALAYAVLRMGRCMHLMKKRNEAIRLYEEVVDYFPNSAPYAAGALYFKGLAERENGDEKKCLATWARMVQDEEYVKQPNSATALNALATAMDKAGENEEAAKYRWRIATDFRKANLAAAEGAAAAVRYHYVVRRPSHETFMAFYKEVGGWGHKGVMTDLDDSEDYWNTVFGTFYLEKREAKESIELKKPAVPYWAAKFGKKFAKDDRMRERIIELQRFADGDDEAWLTRMRQQADSMPMTMGRLLHWLEVFRDHPKVKDHYLKNNEKLIAGAGTEELTRLITLVEPAYRSKLFQDHIAGALSGMTRAQLMGMIEYMKLNGVDLNDEAMMVFSAIDLKDASDDELVSIAHVADRLKGEQEALKIFDRMKDKKACLKAKYDWYLRGSGWGTRNFDADKAQKALGLIDEVARYPEWAEETKWIKADRLHRLGRYAEAIKAYKATNQQPGATWGVVDCLLAMKKYDEAITAVKPLESVGGGTAAAACMKVADIYRMAGDKTKEVEQLRLVLLRYSGSSESSAAHQRLEKYGAKVTGGKATAD